MAQVEVKFTDEHRAAAGRAKVHHMVAVLDRGPPEPKAAEAVKGERTPAEIEAENTRVVLAKREHDEWHKKHKEPVVVEMYHNDAAHAVAADPDRYVTIPKPLFVPVTLDERVTRLEQRMGPETVEEIDKRDKRDADAAAKQAKAPVPQASGPFSTVSQGAPQSVPQSAPLPIPPKEV